MEELISIIIPIYNSERYLVECIESVINQTYSKLEILLINDGSTDNSLNICYDMSKKDERIIVYDKPNSGVSDTRNFGIKKSLGKYIMFVDSDDILDANCCEILLKKINNYKCDLVISNLTRNIKKLGTDNIKKELVFENDKLDLYLTIYNNQNKKIKYTEGPVAKLYLKEIIINNNVKYNKNLKFGEDSLFNLEYYYNSKKICFISKCLYYYRNNSNSTMNCNYNYFYNSIFKTMNEHENKLKELGIFSILKDDFYVFKFRQINKLVKKALNTNNPKANYLGLLSDKSVKNILLSQNKKKLVLANKLKRYLYIKKMYLISKLLHKCI